LKDLTKKIGDRKITSPLIKISNYTREGVQEISQIIEKGKTYCLLGSSGVGKSTLINNLLGSGIVKTGVTSSSTKKGRHVTTHRELFILKNGGILIDNPGMREVGIADAKQGLEDTFDIIFRLSGECKYKNCTHIHESGCAVLEAVEGGEIDRESYENYLKLEREKVYFESSVADKRKKDKDFGKMIKNFKKDKKHLNGSI
jgi:ribosome biogenesis GTPase